MLAQVKSCVVTELVINLDLGGEHQLDNFDWLGVIDALLHPQFGQLHRIFVVLGCEDDVYPTVSRLVREDRFGDLSDRGIPFIEKSGLKWRVD